jgi:hypothetical protein
MALEKGRRSGVHTRIISSASSALTALFENDDEEKSSLTGAEKPYRYPRVAGDIQWTRDAGTSDAVYSPSFIESPIVTLSNLYLKVPSVDDAASNIGIKSVWSVCQDVDPSVDILYSPTPLPSPILLEDDLTPVSTSSPVDSFLDFIVEPDRVSIVESFIFSPEMEPRSITPEFITPEIVINPSYMDSTHPIPGIDPSPIRPLSTILEVDSFSDLDPHSQISDDRVVTLPRIQEESQSSQQTIVPKNIESPVNSSPYEYIPPPIEKDRKYKPKYISASEKPSFDCVL